MNREIRPFSIGRVWLLAPLALVGGFIAVTATSFVSWLLVAGLVGVGVLWLLSGTHTLSTTDRDTASDAEDAVETLKQQYSTGEIDEIEFERRLERLLETEDDLDGGPDSGASRSTRTAQADETNTGGRDESGERKQGHGTSATGPPRRRPPDRSRCNQRGKRPRGSRR